MTACLQCSEPFRTDRHCRPLAHILAPLVARRQRWTWCGWRGLAWNSAASWHGVYSHSRVHMLSRSQVRPISPPPDSNACSGPLLPLPVSSRGPRGLIASLALAAAVGGAVADAVGVALATAVGQTAARPRQYRGLQRNRSGDTGCCRPAARVGMGLAGEGPCVGQQCRPHRHSMSPGCDEIPAAA